MKLEQKGITLIEGLLILLIVSFISFAGWYVWNANKKPVAVPAATSNNTSRAAVADSAHKTFSHPELGFTFSYPSGWETLDTTTDYGFYSLRLRAPGTVVESNMGEVIKSGAEILLLRDRATLIGNIQQFANSDLGKGLTAKKTITVGGVEALEYDRDSGHGIQFYKGGVSYNLSLDKDKYAQAPYGDTFDGIVASIKFN